MAIRAPGHELAIRGQTRLLKPLTVTRLAEVAVTDRPTLTRNLRLLEPQGLIWNEVQAQVATRVGSERFARLLSDHLALVEVARRRELFGTYRCIYRCWGVETRDQQRQSDDLCRPTDGDVDRASGRGVG